MSLVGGGVKCVVGGETCRRGGETRGGGPRRVGGGPGHVDGAVEDGRHDRGPEGMGWGWGRMGQGWDTCEGVRTWATGR